MIMTAQEKAIMSICKNGTPDEVMDKLDHKVRSAYGLLKTNSPDTAAPDHTAAVSDDTAEPAGDSAMLSQDSTRQETEPLAV